MNKPIIILSAQAMKQEPPFKRDYFCTNSFNTQAIQKAGGIPVISPFENEENAEELLKISDGLFLTGGADISPSLYNEEQIPECGKCDIERDRADMNLLKAAYKLKKPVLCICRGCQLGNMFFGGSLYQDLPTQKKSDINHSFYDEYDLETAHGVKILNNTPFYEIFGTDRIKVNSLHHQAVKTLGKDLRPAAYSDDGITEGWYLDDPEREIIGIQWHPEMLSDSRYGKAVFDRFIYQCRNFMK